MNFSLNFGRIIYISVPGQYYWGSVPPTPSPVRPTSVLVHHEFGARALLSFENVGRVCADLHLQSTHSF